MLQRLQPQGLAATATVTTSPNTSPKCVNSGGSGEVFNPFERKSGPLQRFDSIDAW